MPKLVLPDIGTLSNQSSAREAMNNNFDLIEEALENTLSRDGATPNQMEADIDLNGNLLLNVGDPVSDGDAVNKRSVGALVDSYVTQIAETLIEGTMRVDTFTALAGQTSFSLSDSPSGVNSVFVFDDGVALIPGVDYTLTGATLQTLVFFVGRTVGHKIVARYAQIAPSETLLRADLATSSLTKGAALLGFRQSGTGAVERTAQSKLQETLSPMDFGAVGDGVADDTAAMNLAIAELNAIGWSKALHLGGKKYKLTSSPTLITSPRSPTIIGDGAQVLVEFPTGDCFTFYSGSGGPQIQNARVEGVEFDSPTVTRVSGNTVRGLNIADMRVENCTFQNQYTAVKFGVHQYPTVQNCTFGVCMRGIELEQGSGGTFSDCRMQTGSGTTPTPGSIGILLTNASGVLITNTDIVRFATGIYGIPATGAGVQFLFLVNVLCDTCDYGMQLSTSGGGVVSSIFADNSWFSSCKQNGVYAAGVKNMRLNNCELIVNHKNGINLIGSEQVRINNCTLGWNNTDNSATGGGISADGVLGLAIRGNLFTNQSGWVSYGATSNQKYGIILSGTASNNVDVVGNSMVNHTTGDLLVSTTPTGTSRVEGNRTSRSNTIASATNVSFEPMHDTIFITGTTLVQNVGLPAFTNQVIRVVTVDGCTINDGFNFKLAGNFVGTANSTLTLMARPGIGWTEVARAII